MKRDECLASIQGMISGEIDMDLKSMRSSVFDLGASTGDSGSVPFMEVLIDAVEMVDLAVIHHMPAGVLRRLRLQATTALSSLWDYPVLKGIWPSIQDA